ncbi:MAG TPA: hypothetical protein PKG90_00700 [Chitinophagaceae bacterium]|nr:hypothetical protein [Chitinophagaceae bacterium]HNU12983.1 hypothetical protein [Chitinophagaceae bacterium]
MNRIFCLLASIVSFLSVVAQPSDAVIRKDLTTPLTLDIKFTKTTGTRQWNSSSGNWEYVRGVHIRLKSKDYPGLVVKVVGDAVYQYMGGTKYSYQKFRTGYNEWEGIPNPTEAEIEKLISTDWNAFYGFYFNKIVKLNSRPTLVKEKYFTWNNPNLVVFYMKINADMLGPNHSVETVEQEFEVRFYRDNIKDPMQRFMSSSGSSNTKVLSTEQLTEGKIRELEKKTLAYTLAEEIAKKEIESLPELKVPDFKTAKEMADFFHDLLRNGTPELLKVAMLKTLAPHLMVDGSKTQFSWQGKEMYDKAAKEAFGGDMKYKDQYCKNYTTTSLTSKSYIYIQSAIARTITMIGTIQVNDGYVDGVAQSKLKLVNLDISVRQDQDAINFINSFSDRKKLCPND